MGWTKSKEAPASFAAGNGMVSRACKLNGLVRHPKATGLMDPTSRIGRSRLERWPHRDRWKTRVFPPAAARWQATLPLVASPRSRDLDPIRSHPPRARRRRHGRRAVPRDPQPVPPLRWAAIQGHGTESTTTHARDRDPRILLLRLLLGDSVVWSGVGRGRLCLSQLVLCVAAISGDPRACFF
jgi:hypothetical protein